MDWRTLIVIELLLNNGNEREMKFTILKIGGAILMLVSQVTLFSIELPEEMENNDNWKILILTTRYWQERRKGETLRGEKS